MSSFVRFLKLNYSVAVCCATAKRHTDGHEVKWLRKLQLTRVTDWAIYKRIGEKQPGETVDMLCKSKPGHTHTRHVIPNYGSTSGKRDASF